MKKILALSFALLFPTAALCDESSDWTAIDTALQVAFTGAAVTDWAQTRRISRGCNQGYTIQNDGSLEEVHCETNPILGRHPRTEQVDLYFTAMLLGHAAVSRLLPKPYRNVWQSLFIGMEITAVQSNYSIGLKATF